MISIPIYEQNKTKVLKKTRKQESFKNLIFPVQSIYKAITQPVGKPFIPLFIQLVTSYSQLDIICN